MHDLLRGHGHRHGGELKARTGMVIAWPSPYIIFRGHGYCGPLLMGGQRRLFILLQTAAIGPITP